MNEKRDKEKFLAIMSGLSAVFKADLSVAALEAYWIALKDYAIDQIQAAAETVMQTRIYVSFPMPAEIIRAIEGDPAGEGLLLAQRILRWATEHGRFDPPPLDAAAQEALDLTGGYKALCAMETKETRWWTKRFAEVFALDNATRHRGIAAHPSARLDQKEPRRLEAEITPIIHHLDKEEHNDSISENTERL